MFAREKDRPLTQTGTFSMVNGHNETYSLSTIIGSSFMPSWYSSSEQLGNGSRKHCQ